MNFDNVLFCIWYWTITCYNLGISLLELKSPWGKSTKIIISTSRASVERGSLPHDRLWGWQAHRLTGLELYCVSLKSEFYHNEKYPIVTTPTRVKKDTIVIKKWHHGNIGLYIGPRKYRTLNKGHHWAKRTYEVNKLHCPAQYVENCPSISKNTS